MTRTLPQPPPVLDSARLLAYAVLDETVRYSGHSSLFVDGKELGAVPCLAICQPSGASGISGVLLFHCSDDWTVLGAAEYPSVAEAKRRAEHIYRGLYSHWIEANVTEQEVARHMDEVWGDKRCSVCGKTPDQVERLLGKNDVRLCDSCIEGFTKCCTRIRKSQVAGANLLICGNGQSSARVPHLSRTM